MKFEVECKGGEAYDVIVVGAGPSGSAAAIAAGRGGAKTLLIEQEYCLGGMWTSGFMNPLFDHENKTGLLAELIADLKERNAWGGFWDESFIYEYMKVLLEDKCRAAGTDFLFDTKYLGVKQENGRVEGVYVTNIEGITFYPCKIVIDATGDGAVSVDAGASWYIGEGEGYSDTTCQAMTLMFLVAGIPEAYRDGGIIYDAVEEAFRKQGKDRHLNFDRPYIIPVPRSDYAVVQLTHMHRFSPLSAKARTEATKDGRRQLLEVFEALKEYHDDFKNLSLISSAPLLGIRESRRILGEYYLTEEDVINGSRFPDGVCTSTFNCDIHSSDGFHQKCIQGKPFQIPYRSLLPKNTDNLLVVGKTISGSHFAMSSYRVTGNCCAMGEKAGFAAAYAVKNGVPLRQVPNEIVCES